MSLAEQKMAPPPVTWRECSVGEGDGSPSERRVRGGLFEEAEAKGGACLVKLLHMFIEHAES